MQTWGSSGASKSETIAAPHNFATGATGAAAAAHHECSETEEYYRVLLGDTTSIWCADPQAPAPPPRGLPGGSSKASLVAQLSPTSATFASQTAMSQAQLRSLRQGSQLQPGDLVSLPNAGHTQQDAVGSSDLSSNHAQRLGNVREHHLRERMHAAANLGGQAAAGPGCAATTYGMLPQRRNSSRLLDPSGGGSNVTTGAAAAGLPPGALQPSLVPPRLSESSTEKRAHNGAAAFQMGPKTAALLDQADGRNIRSGWQS